MRKLMYVIVLFVMMSFIDNISKASYYGKEHHGKRTASGQLFDMNKLTAAHRSLPFGTKVLITNVDNGKSVIVVINDRGPFVKSREFDLSKAAFEKISNIKKGVTSIEWSLVEDKQSY